MMTQRINHPKFLPNHILLQVVSELMDQNAKQMEQQAKGEQVENGYYNFNGKRLYASNFYGDFCNNNDLDRCLEHFCQVVYGKSQKEVFIAEGKAELEQRAEAAMQRIVKKQTFLNRLGCCVGAFGPDDVALLQRYYTSVIPKIPMGAAIPREK